MYGLKNVRSRRTDALTRVGWDRLEVLLAEHYRRQGWQVDHIGTGGNVARFDGGVDLRLRRTGELVVVQCKHWNAKQVPHNAVHELLGIMVTEGASGAILVTSGEFTRYAIESAAKAGRLQLIDGDDLRGLLGPFADPESVSSVPAVSIGFRANVSERLLAAAEDRIRHGVRGRRPAELAVTGLALKGGLLLIATCLVVAVAGRLLEDAVSRLNSHAALPAAQTAQEPKSMRAPMRTARPQTTAAPSFARAVAVDHPCHELIDAPSGTYIDHCASAALPKRQSTAEIRESQRKADEAAAILAPYVPEI